MVYRDTPRTPLVVLTEGAVLTADDLNKVNTQLSYVAEELTDGNTDLSVRASLVPLGAAAPQFDPSTPLTDGSILYINGGELEAQPPEVVLSKWLAGLSLSGLSGHIYASKADAMDALAGIPVGTYVQVLVDETRSNTYSIYQRQALTLHYVTTIQSSHTATTTSTGVFFDSTAGDLFTGTKISVPTDPTLTTTAGSIAFSSASTVTLDAKVKDSAGNILKEAFDDVTVEATFTITSFPAVNAPGVLAGLFNEVGTDFTMGRLRASSPSATSIFADLWNTGKLLANDTASYAFTAGASVHVKLHLSGTALTFTVTYPSTPDHVLSITLVYDSTSFEMPRMFNALGVRFQEGVITLTSLKAYAGNPNADFAFMGDSITQGRFASAYANGYAAKVRAAQAGRTTLIAGAPSAWSSDWVTRLPPFTAMLPQYAFILLGTNDLANNRAVASIQTDLTTIANTLIEADITPIFLTVPPNGHAATATLNTWIKAQSWSYVDIYPSLVGADGVSLNSLYDHGDGIHPNDAGHTVIADAVNNFITTNGL
jgi:lysophospholipase L1-like esterase